MLFRKLITLLVISSFVVACGGSGEDNQSSQPSEPEGPGDIVLQDPVTVTVPPDQMMIDEVTAPYFTTELIGHFYLVRNFGYEYERSPGISINEADNSIHYQMETDENGNGHEIVEFQNYRVNGFVFNGQVHTEIEWTEEEPYLLTATSTYAQYTIASDSYITKIDGTLQWQQVESGEAGQHGVVYTSNLYVRYPEWGVNTLGMNLVFGFTPDGDQEKINISGTIGDPDFGYLDVTSSGQLIRDSGAEFAGIAGDGSISLAGSNGNAVNSPISSSFLFGEIKNGAVTPRYYRIDQDLVYPGSVFGIESDPVLPMVQGTSYEGTPEDTFTLDARGSVRPDGGPYSVNWSVLSGPVGSQEKVNILNPNAAVTTVTFPEQGFYTIQLSFNAGGIERKTRYLFDIDQYDSSFLDMQNDLRAQHSDSLDTGDRLYIDTRGSELLDYFGEPSSPSVMLFGTSGIDYDLDSYLLEPYQGFDDLKRSQELEDGQYVLSIFNEGYLYSQSVIAVGDQPIEFEDPLLFTPVQILDVFSSTGPLIASRKIVEGTTDFYFLGVDNTAPVIRGVRFSESGRETVATISVPDMGTFRAFEDVNGDSIKDIVFDEQSHCVAILPGTENGFATDPVRFLSGDGSCRIHAVANVDGIDRKQIILSDDNRPNVIPIYSIDDDFTIHESREVAKPEDMWLIRDVVDFDGDGADELLESNVCYMSVWKVADMEVNLIEETPDSADCLDWDYSVGDLNSDGMMDVLGFDEESGQPVILFQDSNGELSRHERVEDAFAFNRGGNNSKPVTVDINSDGIDDFLFINNPGGHSFVRNAVMILGREGDQSTVVPQVSKWTFTLMGHLNRVHGVPMVVDITLDGSPDLVMQTIEGHIILANKH